jgi:catechol 2,3-dioxygenase
MIGRVRLRVADVGRVRDYYERTIGLRVLEEDGDTVTLGADSPLVELVGDPGAQPAPPGSTGLFHLAILVPSRPELARSIQRVVGSGERFTGASDHFVSEALYLSDPDGHGIEIYSDRPREVWEGQVARMTNLPLDVDSLFGELDDPASEPFDGLTGETVMGHVHLRVADIAQTVAFYRDVLGFGLMTRFGTQAAFLAAGGYHHHIGANTWESRGAGPPPPGHAGLRHFTIVLPDDAERERVLARADEAGAVHDGSEGPIVRDPSGTGLVLVT